MFELLSFFSPAVVSQINVHRALFVLLFFTTFHDTAMKGVAVVVVFGYAGSQAVDGIVQRLISRSHPGDVTVGHAEYVAIHRFVRTGVFQIEGDVDKHLVRCSAGLSLTVEG